MLTYLEPLSDYKKEIVVAIIVLLIGFAITLIPLGKFWWLWSIFFLSIILLYNYKPGLYLLAPLILIEAQHLVITTSHSLQTDFLGIYFPLLVIVFIGWLMRKLAKLPSEIDGIPPHMDLFVFFFLGWSTLTLFWTPNFEHGFIQWGRFIGNVLLFYIIANGLDSEKDHQRVVGLLILMGVIISIAGFISLYYDHDTIYTKKLSNMVSLSLKFYTYPKRAMGLTAHNAAASILNILMALTFACFLSARKKWLKGLLFLALLAMASGHLYTRSRGGLIAGMVMWLFLLVGIPTLRKKFLKNLLLFLFLFITLFSIINYEGFDRHDARFSSKRAEHSLKERYGWWIKGTHLLYEKSTGAGLGIGGLKYYFDSLSIPHAHQVHLSFLFDFGVIGFIFYLYFIIFIAKALYVVLHQFQETYIQLMLWACSGALITILVHGFIDAEYNIATLWFFWGFTIATLRLAKKEIEKNRSGGKNINAYCIG